LERKYILSCRCVSSQLLQTDFVRSYTVILVTRSDFLWRPIEKVASSFVNGI
jgi:hypothetical protein